MERVVIRKALDQSVNGNEGLGHIELSINLSGKSIESDNDFKIIEEMYRHIRLTIIQLYLRLQNQRLLQIQFGNGTT